MLFNYIGLGWEEKAKRDIKELGMNDVDWIDLARGKGKRRAVVNMVINFGFPKNVGAFYS
jgi:hypothetical protein